MVSRAPHKIKDLFAFISEDSDGTEGLLGFWHEGTMMPMVASDLQRMKSLIPIADIAAKQQNRVYRIMHFVPADPHDVTDQYK